VPQIRAFLSAERRSRRKTKGLSVALQYLQKLQDPLIASYLCIPFDADDFVARIKSDHVPVTVFVSKHAVEMARDHGQIIGLDSIYKISVKRWPMWVVTIQNERGAGFPLSFICASSGVHQALQEGITILFDYIRVHCFFPS
jgi:hypothetical protein